MGITALPLTNFVVFIRARYLILVLKVTPSFTWNDPIKPLLGVALTRVRYFVLTGGKMRRKNKN